MKNLLEMHEFSLGENVEEVQADEITPRMAGILLKMAAKQKENKFQGSYTVD